MSRKCVVCGGITYAPVEGNNWVCLACWESYCPEGLPEWIRYLVNQTKYEGRQKLGEHVRYDKWQRPLVKMTGRGHTCSISLINENEIERVLA